MELQLNREELGLVEFGVLKVVSYWGGRPCINSADEKNRRKQLRDCEELLSKVRGVKRC